jgi:hypothetical protein
MKLRTKRTCCLCALAVGVLLHGWTDPIHVDVGVPSLGYSGPEWPVTDWNHRVCAAILRGDPLITVDVSGQVDHAAMILGVPQAQVTGFHGCPARA